MRLQVRVISDCHFAVQLNHFRPILLSYSVAVFLKVTIGYHPIAGARLPHEHGRGRRRGPRRCRAKPRDRRPRHDHSPVNPALLPVLVVVCCEKVLKHAWWLWGGGADDGDPLAPPWQARWRRATVASWSISSCPPSRRLPPSSRPMARAPPLRPPPFARHFRSTGVRARHSQSC